MSENAQHFANLLKDEARRFRTLADQLDPPAAPQPEAGAGVTEEEIAKILAYMDWPLASEEERIRWRDKHWREYTPPARAILARIQHRERGRAPI